MTHDYVNVMFVLHSGFHGERKSKTESVIEDVATKQRNKHVNAFPNSITSDVTSSGEPPASTSASHVCRHVTRKMRGNYSKSPLRLSCCWLIFRANSRQKLKCFLVQYLFPTIISGEMKRTVSLESEQQQKNPKNVKKSNGEKINKRILEKKIVGIRELE